MIHRQRTRRAVCAAIALLLTFASTACNEHAPWEVGKPWGGGAVIYPPVPR